MCPKNKNCSLGRKTESALPGHLQESVSPGELDVSGSLWGGGGGRQGAGADTVEALGLGPCSEGDGRGS